MFGGWLKCHHLSAPKIVLTVVNLFFRFRHISLPFPFFHSCSRAGSIFSACVSFWSLPFFSCVFFYFFSFQQLFVRILFVDNVTLTHTHTLRFSEYHKFLGHTHTHTKEMVIKCLTSIFFFIIERNEFHLTTSIGMGKMNGDILMIGWNV